MSTYRFAAMQELFSREPITVPAPADKVSEFYGVNTFDLETMKKYLPTDAFQSVKKAIDTWGYIDRSVADAAASAMKAWAMERGVTHYTHWFHPLTGATAEFISIWFLMTVGNQPFYMKNNKLCFKFEPVLTGELFTKKMRKVKVYDNEQVEIVTVPKNCFLFKLFEKTIVVYHNPEMKNTFGKNSSCVKQIELTYFNNKKKLIENNILEEPYSHDIRNGNIKRIDVLLD